MEPFSTITAIAAPIDRVDVDTDQIIPQVYLKSIGKTGFGKFLFARWRYINEDPSKPNPEFVLNQPRYKGARVLVTRDNFGCGSSREHAPWALTDYGFRVVIAPSFGDILYNNSLKNGLLPARVTREDADKLIKEVQANDGLEIRVDLKEQVISTSKGTSVRFEIGKEAKDKLLSGLDDIGLTLQHDKEISAFEQRRKQQMPWMG
ncbi:MAG TPA: 3-isopropylmalate dehydratase small subunit [bacterium]